MPNVDHVAAGHDTVIGSSVDATTTCRSGDTWRRQIEDLMSDLANTTERSGVKPADSDLSLDSGNRRGNRLPAMNAEANC